MKDDSGICAICGDRYRYSINGISGDAAATATWRRECAICQLPICRARECSYTWFTPGQVELRICRDCCQDQGLPGRELTEQELKDLRWQKPRKLPGDGGPLAGLKAADLRSASRLKAMLKSTEAVERRKAAEALRNLETRAASAVSELAAALGDSQVKVRLRAAEALEVVGEKRRGAGAQLTAALLSDPSERVRETAARALGRLPTSECRLAAPALVNALSDRSSAVADAAQQALEGKFGGAPGPAALRALGKKLGDSGMMTALKAETVLLQLGNDGIDLVELVEELLVKASPPVRQMAVSLLGTQTEHRDRAAKVLQRIQAGKDRDLAEWADESLSRLEDPD